LVNQIKNEDESGYPIKNYKLKFAQLNKAFRCCFQEGVFRKEGGKASPTSPHSNTTLKGNDFCLKCA
jgi:hypothetical protein